MAFSECLIAQRKRRDPVGVVRFRGFQVLMTLKGLAKCPKLGKKAQERLSAREFRTLY